MALKYKVGDRVRIKSIDWYNENKNRYGNINCGYMPFTSEMSVYCGEVLTICDIKEEFSFYHMKKCEYQFTDEMIECKVGEETKSHNNMCKQLIDEMNPNVEVETETHRGYYTTDPETTCEGKKICVFYFWDSDFADKVELDLSGGRELIQEDGKWFVVKKKKEYPKTYEECCEILDCSYNIQFDRCETSYESKLHDKLLILRELLICRDAYWKLYGEEMGLGKPWEPDYTKERYIIYKWVDEIFKGYKAGGFGERFILEFPTEEMRDAFKENFDPDIEICKIFL